VSAAGSSITQLTAAQLSSHWSCPHEEGIELGSAEGGNVIEVPLNITSMASRQRGFGFGVRSAKSSRNWGGRSVSQIFG
jgi:hypothetical protein